MTTTELTFTPDAAFSSPTLRHSRAQVMTGRVLTSLATLFLLFDGVAKLFRPRMVLEGTVQLGYSPDVIIPLGVVLLVCLALYVVPRTAALGALLLTGYLGGAVATHVRVGDPLFSHILFPAYVAVLIWGGLVLRNPALRVILPVRQHPR